MSITDQILLNNEFMLLVRRLDILIRVFRAKAMTPPTGAKGANTVAAALVPAAYVAPAQQRAMSRQNQAAPGGNYGVGNYGTSGYTDPYAAQAYPTDPYNNGVYDPNVPPAYGGKNGAGKRSRSPGKKQVGGARKPRRASSKT